MSTDALVKKYKNKKPIIPFIERLEVIRSLKFVDSVVTQNSLNKFTSLKKLK